MNPGGFCEAFLDTGYLERDAQLVCMKYSLYNGHISTFYIAFSNGSAFASMVSARQRKSLVFVAKTNTVVGPSGLL